MNPMTESRKVFRIAKDMFQATVNNDQIGVVLGQAKLRAICGSWYYLGLHYNALGDVDESKECMKMALQLCPNRKTDDIIHSLPILHMTVRHWFDDEEF